MKILLGARHRGVNKKESEEPDERIEEYFRGLYEKYGDDPRVIYEYASVLDYLG